MGPGRLRVRVFSAVAAVFLLLQLPAGLFASWGLEVGRADGGDVGRLASDWGAFKRGRDRFDRVHALAQLSAIERQRQMLGVAADNWGPQQVFEELENQWLMEIMAPLQSIALNPAATCEEAKFAFSKLMGMQRQRQLLGLDESETINRIHTATEGMTALRCKDEALDECVATGRFRQIIDLMMGLERQSQLLGRNDDLESWADDALKQCAIYELHFVSKTKGGHGPMGVETTRDGKVKVKYQSPPGGLKAAISGPLGEILKGETTGGNNPFFVSVKCTSPTPIAELVCSQGADSTPIKVRINELDLRHPEYYIDMVKGKDWMTASEFSKQRMVGEDKFSFEFEGGMFSLQGVIKAPYNTASIPFPDWGNTFYMAHKKDMIGGERSGKLLIKNNTRGVTPAIFQFNYADQNTFRDALTTDTTDFELVHKPEPKPFSKPPDPIRKPLRPRPN